MRAWDMRPYAPQNRCVKVFTGHQHSFERNSLRCDWSPDGTKVGYPPPLPLSHTALTCLQHETAAPKGDHVVLRLVLIMRSVCLTGTVLSAWEL